jgi:hypothetical protein
MEDLENKINKTEQFFIDIEIEDYNNSSNQYFTELDEVDGVQTIAILNN